MGISKHGERSLIGKALGCDPGRYGFNSHYPHQILNENLCSKWNTGSLPDWKNGKWNTGSLPDWKNGKWDIIKKGDKNGKLGSCR